MKDKGLKDKMEEEIEEKVIFKNLSEHEDDFDFDLQILINRALVVINREQLKWYSYALEMASNKLEEVYILIMKHEESERILAKIRRREAYGDDEDDQ